VTHRRSIVLVRGLFADTSVPSGLRYLPGNQRALTRFPSTQEPAQSMDSAGSDAIGRR
jgi:hypothetical protein